LVIVKGTESISKNT